jgi:MFS family permease
MDTEVLWIIVPSFGALVVQPPEALRAVSWQAKPFKLLTVIGMPDHCPDEVSGSGRAVAIDAVHPQFGLLSGSRHDRFGPNTKGRAMATGKAAAGPGEWARNWPLLASATAGLSFGAIPTASLGVFMVPLEAEFGWSRTSMSLGLTLFALISTPLAPFIGALADRFGSRAVAVPGVGLTGLSFAGFGLMTGAVWQWLALWSLLALTSLLIRSMIWNRVISAAFVKSRGLAIALLLSGMSVSGAVAPILTDQLINAYGWQGGYFGLGIGWAGLAFILTLLFFHEPGRERAKVPTPDHQAETQAPQSGLTLQEAFRNPRILRITLAVFLQVTVIASVSVHLVPIHMSFGVTSTQAAGIAIFLGVGALTGKIATGSLADRYNSALLPLIAYALPGLGFAILLAGDGSSAVLSLATLIVGLGSGAALHMTMYLTTQYGGLAHFGKIFGSISSLMGLASGIGPLLAGYIYDTTGDYRLFMAITIPVLLIAGLSAFRLGPYPDWSSPSDAPAAA